jgi:tRNA(fMet)-specific endonuclease VapC
LKNNNRIALDSNAFIAYRQGIGEVCKLVDRSGEIFVPVIVIGELLFGALNSTHVAKNRAAIATLTQNSIVAFIDQSIAERYADVRLALKQGGTPIPENDMWIAASCLRLDVPLLTNDKHFDLIPDLEVIHW